MTYNQNLSAFFDNFCKVIAVILSLLYLALTPIFVGLLLPFAIYRWVICQVAHCVHPDLKILTLPNTAIASVDKFNGENQNTTVIAIKVRGTPNIEETRKHVMEKIIEAKLSNGSDKLRNPELKQYPKKWMGYYFWKPDKNFDVKNHVYFYSKGEKSEISLDGSVKVYSEEDAARVEAELVTKPHLKGRSPWEFVILSPVKDPDDENQEYSYIYYRNHHLITDGFGILNLMMDLCGIDMLRKPPSAPKSSILQKYFYYATQLFRASYDLLMIPLTTLPRIENKFRLPNEELEKKHIGAKPLCIPLEKLKEIRKRNNTSITAIQYSLWAGALRRIMTRNNLQIPDFIHCSCPQSLPFQHPEKLRIFAGFWIILLPTGIEDPLERLKNIEKRIKNLRRSAHVLASYYFLKAFLGPLPPDIINAFYPSKTGTTCLNCFPGPPVPCSIFNRDVTQVHFSYGQTQAAFSTLFSSISYCGNVYMKTTINEKIYTKMSEVEQFQNCMLEELEALSKETV